MRCAMPLAFMACLVLTGCSFVVGGDGKPCVSDGDCDGLACIDGVCADGPRETCDDGLENQAETDVDCGGPTCLPCVDDSSCIVDADCESLNCDNGTCACQNECEVLDVHCEGSNRSDCMLAGDCLGWAAGTECAETSEVCVNMQCVVPGSCGTAPCNSPAPMFASVRNDTDHLSPIGIDEFVVEDRDRGLMWKRCPEGLGLISCAGVRESLTWQAAYDRCAALDYAGYQDWRLPDRFDLQSIHRYGEDQPIDATAFPVTGALWYWTAHTDASNFSLAWRIQSDTGLFESRDKGDVPKGYVRCVRRMTPAPPLPALRFHRTRNDEPIATDAVTGLVWQACPPSLSGPECDQPTGVADTRTQAAASGTYCPTLSWGSHPSGWRLPTTKELSSLVHDSQAPPIDDALGPVATDEVYLTADVLPGNPDRPYAVDFTDGSVIALFDMDTPASVRCVHAP